jgi:hypothetical protein
MMWETREQAAYGYVTRQSQDLFFVLSCDWRILEANESVRSLTGCRENDTAFSDRVVDFAGTFNLTDLVQARNGPHLLNIKTAAGPPPRAMISILSRYKTGSWFSAVWMPGNWRACKNSGCR